MKTGVIYPGIGRTNPKYIKISSYFIYLDPNSQRAKDYVAKHCNRRANTQTWRKTEKKTWRGMQRRKHVQSSGVESCGIIPGGIAAKIWGITIRDLVSRCKFSCLIEPTRSKQKLKLGFVEQTPPW